MTHRTRAAPALTVSASWLHKSHVARLQAQPRQDRKGITAGSIPHRPLGLGAFRSNRHPVYPGVFNTEELERNISKVAIPFVLPDCPPGTQVFRGKGNERPKKAGHVPCVQERGHPGSTTSWRQEFGRVSLQSSTSSSLKGDASRTVLGEEGNAGCCHIREMGVRSPQRTKYQSMPGD